jgi:type IV secretory pathway VirB10-like protein
METNKKPQQQPNTEKVFDSLLSKDDVIKPLIGKKTKRNKKYMLGFIVLGSISMCAVFAYAHKLSQQKSILGKKEEVAKIENTAPKKFNVLPVTTAVSSETQASATSVNNQITDDLALNQPNQNNQTNQSVVDDKADLYNSDLTSKQQNQNIENKDVGLLQITSTQSTSNNNNTNNNFKDVEASKLQGSLATTIIKPEFTIVKGAFLDAILETQIDSSLQGMVSAILSHDVYSVNGKVLLLEKGSKIVGEYTKAIKEGAERLFVVWGRIITPEGVMIDLDSMGTDSLGKAGLSGEINHQYGKRFGSALLLSLIGDSVTALSKTSQVTNNIGNTQEQTKSLAEQALSNNINIAPILYKNQGEYINIFVARDLDFSAVYKLQLKGRG